MNSQHAPGPWYVFEGYEDDNPQYTVESSVTIAYIRESTFNQNPEATARLMAAAPDLLEALQHLMVAHGEQLDYAFQQAQDAIAKATGETK